MEIVTENWTDGRLEDLSKRVDEGFARVDEQFARIDRRFERIDKRFERIDKRFERVDDRFQEMNLRFETAQREADRRNQVLLREMNTRLDAVQHSIVYGLIGLLGVFVALLGVATRL